MLTAIRRVRARLPLARRADDAVELLDSGALSRFEVERNLADLERLNRLPGGTRASVAGIRRLAGPDDRLRVLDVGTGRGDMPLAFGRAGWTTVGVDTNAEVLAVAGRRTAGWPGIEVVQGDARALPFEDGAFDVAHCSLVLHHLDRPDAVRALRELRRVASRGVVINDLQRGIAALYVTWLTVISLGRSRVTRADGPVSVRRAYTVDELDALLAEAGLASAWRSPRWMPRVVTAAAPA